MRQQRPRSGRPPLDDEEPSVQVCVSVPASQYDHLFERARTDRVSVPEVIRRQLDPPTKKYTK